VIGCDTNCPSHLDSQRVGRHVIFTLDRSGYCNVYQVNLLKFDSLPLADAK